MMRALPFCGAVAALLASPTSAGDLELLWDNGIVPDGSNWARAISPPVFPDIRVADDFVVPDGETWLLSDWRFSALEDAGWEHNDVVTLFLYEDAGECPGDLMLEVDTGFDREFMGVFFDRDTYTYFLDPVDLVLESGEYWCGIRNPLGGGQGTNYWGSGDGGGRDGLTSEPGCFSLDAGRTWLKEGPDGTWWHAFQIRGFRSPVASPGGFEITRGEQVSGGLLSIRDSDDEYLVIEARKPIKVSQPSVQVIVSATVTRDDPEAVAISVEASVLTGGAIQWIDLYDFDEERWVRLDERAASTDDTITPVVVTEDAARYVEAGTRQVAARISFYDLNVPIAAWIARIDRVAWFAFPP